ncbi:unnamed protein product, partial [marine sediment metagenome]
MIKVSVDVEISNDLIREIVRSLDGYHDYVTTVAELQSNPKFVTWVKRMVTLYLDRFEQDM